MTAVRPPTGLPSASLVSIRPLPRAIADGRAFDALLDRREARSADSGSAAAFGERGMFGRHGAAKMPATKTLPPNGSGGVDQTADSIISDPIDRAPATPDLTLVGRDGNRVRSTAVSPVDAPAASKAADGPSSQLIAACQQALATRAEAPSPEPSQAGPAGILRRAMLQARPSVALISLTGPDTALTVVAHVASGTVDGGELRRRVQALAQQFGVTVTDLVFTPSGQPSATPTGGIHGHSPR
ncbi:hypothetical protein [Flavisphingomonas formosensis]|uniref:hypothetical protein n=1 Tax=Flavisphingomonas formosensis TaxID=861534 RepID=UPI0012FAB260|nr:hypothetical protein [Sphingomonas formosensis]